MNFLTRFRLGIGFDIEHNEINRYCLTDEEGKSEDIVCFVGLMIRLPFIEILIGDFFEE